MFFVTPDALLRRAEKCSYAKSIERTHPQLSGEHTPWTKSLQHQVFPLENGDHKEQEGKTVTDET